MANCDYILHHYMTIKTPLKKLKHSNRNKYNINCITGIELLVEVYEYIQVMVKHVLPSECK